MTDIDTRLRAAASRGELEAVEGLIGAGADPNARNWGGNTALHFAAAKDSVQVIEVLLAAGADRTVVNVYGANALDIAVRDGRAAAAARLRALLRSDDTAPE